MIHHIICAERYFLITAINRIGRSINKVFYRMVSACFKNIEETNHIGFHIYIRMINGITYSSLNCQVDYNSWLVFCKYFFYQFFIRNGSSDKYMSNIRLFRSLFPSLFDGIINLIIILDNQ